MPQVSCVAKRSGERKGEKLNMSWKDAKEKRKQRINE
jgi:hypothetical protein